MKQVIENDPYDCRRVNLAIKLDKINNCGTFRRHIVIETTTRYPSSGGNDLQWHEKFVERATYKFISRITVTPEQIWKYFSPYLNNNTNALMYSLTLELLEGSRNFTHAVNLDNTDMSVNFISDEIITDAELDVIRKRMFADYIKQYDNFQRELAAENAGRKFSWKKLFFRE